MTRLGSILALAFILAAGLTHAGEKDLQFNGMLTKADPKDQQRGGPMKTHVVKLKGNVRYTIDMIGNGLDSYLRLLDPKGKQLEEDDDSGGDQNARIIFSCPRDGDYTIVCTTFSAGQQGPYTLTVKTGDGLPRPVSAHTQMVGQPAPDFQANFTVNGKASKLADFKGKVVLLHFIDVRSSSSSALLSKVIDWQKAYAKEGVVPVALTYYPSDIGQTLGLDAEGKIKTVATADRKSDQALMKAFAAHRKIDYPVLILTKQNALSTFDTYVVNGFPQVVLIDRAGSVRMIDVSGEKGAANVETELKKILGMK